MATMQGTVSPMFGRILKQIRRAWGEMTMWGVGGMLKELHLHSENPFGNRIWIPPLIFWLYRIWSLLWRVRGIIVHTKMRVLYCNVHSETIGSSSYVGIFPQRFSCCPEVAVHNKTESKCQRSGHFLQTLYFPHALCPWLSMLSLSQVSKMPSPFSLHWGNECLSQCPGWVWKV